MSTDEIPGWFSSNALRILLGLVLTIVGWYVTTSLAEIKMDLRETTAAVQEVKQGMEGFNVRLANVEQVSNRNADRIHEVERQVWQGRPSVQSSTNAPH